jgi:hypothetical protein
MTHKSLLTKLGETHYPSGLAAEYQFSLASIARMLAEVGLTTESAALLESLSASLQDKNALVALAENGAVAQADEGLQKQVRDHGHETLWKSERIPETRAAMFLAEHKPEQVASALEPALPFDGLTFGPAFLRGQAYLRLASRILHSMSFARSLNMPTSIRCRTNTPWRYWRRRVPMYVKMSPTKPARSSSGSSVCGRRRTRTSRCCDGASGI